MADPGEGGKCSCLQSGDGDRQEGLDTAACGGEDEEGREVMCQSVSADHARHESEQKPDKGQEHDAAPFAGVVHAIGKVAEEKTEAASHALVVEEPRRHAEKQAKGGRGAAHAEEWQGNATQRGGFQGQEGATREGQKPEQADLTGQNGAPAADAGIVKGVFGFSISFLVSFISSLSS